MALQLPLDAREPGLSLLPCRLCFGVQFIALGRAKPSHKVSLNSARHSLNSARQRRDRPSASALLRMTLAEGRTSGDLPPPRRREFFPMKARLTPAFSLSLPPPSAALFILAASCLFFGIFALLSARNETILISLAQKVVWPNKRTGANIKTLGCRAGGDRTIRSGARLALS